MGKCFSCGVTFKGSVNDLLRIYKKQYLSKGIERYYYKLHEKGDIFIVRKSSFKTIFEKEIQPNFKNGAEFAHIQEFDV